MLCAGAAADAHAALMDCICEPSAAACADECPYMCTGTGTPADDATSACNDCQTYALAAPCSAEVATCTTN